MIITSHLQWLFHSLWLSFTTPLRWRHNGRDSVSNHQPHGCLLNRLLRRRSKKTSKLRVTGLCAGNSPGTAEMFPFDDVIMKPRMTLYWGDGPILLLPLDKRGVSINLNIAMHQISMDGELRTEKSIFSSYARWCPIKRHSIYCTLIMTVAFKPIVEPKLNIYIFRSCIQELWSASMHRRISYKKCVFKKILKLKNKNSSFWLLSASHIFGTLDKIKLETPYHTIL